ncbi:hypothetical protein Tco_1434717, partial [Tanacetum coccineum]
PPWHLIACLKQCGPHQVARESRPGKNPWRAFPFNLSRATCRPGFVSPATSRPEKPENVAGDSGLTTLFISKNCQRKTHKRSSATSLTLTLRTLLEVAAKILNRKELEFYKWDCDLPQLLQNVRDKLFKVAKDWTRDEKNHCGGDDDEDDSYEWVADQQSRKMNLHGIKSRSMEINYLLRLKRIRCRWMETNSLLRLKTIRSRWMEAETEENQKSLDGKELAADMDVGWKRIIC